jgi:hypothetical protein
MLHVDVKKLGNVPDGVGGAWSAAPRASATGPPPPDAPVSATSTSAPG